MGILDKRAGLVEVAAEGSDTRGNHIFFVLATLALCRPQRGPGLESELRTMASGTSLPFLRLQPSARVGRLSMLVFVFIWSFGPRSAGARNTFSTFSDKSAGPQCK